MADIAALNRPTDEGIELIAAWQRLLQALKDNERERSRLDCELVNAINALGRWITPHDAKEGETFNVWNGDNLISVKKKEPTKNYGGGDYEIAVRTRGKRGELANG